MHYRARQYDPMLGRFMQADTITVDGLNRYTHVRNNPMRYTDPSGMCVNADLTIMSGIECQPQGQKQVLVGGKWETVADGNDLFPGIDLFDYIELAVYQPISGNDYNSPSDAMGAINDRVNTHYNNLGGPISGLGTVGMIVLSMVPYVGEAIDAYDCYHGSKLACSSFFVPFVSGRLLGVGHDILRAAPSGAVTCLANSFVPGTEVLMADGTTKRIKDVKVGGWVWAHDPETGETGPRQVIDTIIGDGEKKLVDIEVLGDTITATDGHPFWVDDQGMWVDAGDLEPGDRLLLANGSRAVVDATVGRGAGSEFAQIQKWLSRNFDWS